MKKDNKAGRGRIEPGKQRRINITLSDRLAEKGREIGKGNLSRGIRKALEEHKQ